MTKYASESREMRDTRIQDNKWPEIYLGECVGIQARGNLQEMSNTMFLVVICWVTNGNDIVLSTKQLQVWYADVKHWEELVDFIDNNLGLKEPSFLASMLKCTLEWNTWEEEYMK